MTLKMKPSLIIFQVEASRKRRASYNQFLPFLKCDVSYSEVDLKYISCISSPLWETSTDLKTKYKCRITEGVSRVSSANAFLISILFMWIWKKKKSALFLLILPLPGGFAFVRQSACFMNVLQWSGFVSLPQKNYKNQVSPTELVCNQFGIALTSMYQSAYWVGWSTMAYQILAMSQYCLLLCWYLLSLFYYTMETFSMWEVRRRFFAIGGILHGLKCFNVMPGLRSYDSPNVNTKSGLLGGASL